tara:strand:- start:1164 stop:1364 length:201 start_codon:yes stop_codon:yes gene_type:complete
MPVSKHHRKKTSNSKLRKAKNIRKAVNQYTEGKTHKVLKDKNIVEADKRFTKAFPDRILKKAYKNI